MTSVLVAGMGNVFCGDDGFGVEVVRLLAAQGRTWPAGVTVADYGIRGLHLAYDVAAGVDALVLVDAMDLGEPPGTLAMVEPEPSGEGGASAIDAHAMSPGVVLDTLARLGAQPPPTLVVGCQPMTVEEQMALSAPVAAALPQAVAMVREAVALLLHQEEALSARTRSVLFHR